MSAWINGRKSARIDHRDRGLQYGDGVFETMRVRRGRVRLLEYHLERLDRGCRQLKIAGPPPLALRRELARVAAGRGEGILKLIVTRGPGARGYRPTGHERCTRIVTLDALPKAILSDAPTPARAMSNLFLRRGSTLMTPVLDRCGVAGVMRRWILERAGDLRLRPVERRIRWQDLREAEEVFMSNAVVGLRSVGVIESGRARLRLSAFETANRLRQHLDAL